MENNIIDIVLIISMLLSGILALSQGFIREILSLFGWVVAFINLKIFMPESTQYVSVFIENKPLANLITISIIFFYSIPIILNNYQNYFDIKNYKIIKVNKSKQN